MDDLDRLALAAARETVHLDFTVRGGLCATDDEYR
jgi:hypothetical protein